MKDKNLDCAVQITRIVLEPTIDYPSNYWFYEVLKFRTCKELLEYLWKGILKGTSLYQIRNVTSIKNYNKLQVEINKMHN